MEMPTLAVGCLTLAATSQSGLFRIAHACVGSLTCCSPGHPCNHREPPTTSVGHPKSVGARDETRT